MEISYTPDALKEREFWKRSGNKSIMKKITTLIKALEENPFEGVGKPEQLKHNLSGYWSRSTYSTHILLRS